MIIEDVRPRFTILLGIALTHAVVSAEVVHIRDYETREPKDRGVLFAMAVTPTQDVLSFVAKESGRWRLTRIRKWADKTPEEQTIDIPGWSKSDNTSRLPASPIIMATADGRYAISVASGFWYAEPRLGKSDDLVSVVDLQDFRLLKTIHPPASPSETRSFYLDSAGRLAMLASTTSQQPYDTRLVLMAVPALGEIGQCAYQEWVQFGKLQKREGEASCAPLLREQAGAIPLAGYLESLKGPSPPLLENPPDPSPCSRVTSESGRFEFESCEIYRRTWWLHPVTNWSDVKVISRKSSTLVGTIGFTNRNSFQARPASEGGREFYLVVEGGTKLKVYEITE